MHNIDRKDEDDDVDGQGYDSLPVIRYMQRQTLEKADIENT